MDLDGPALKTIKMLSVMKKTAKDGLKNVLTGLGVEGKDKRLGAKYSPIRMSQARAEMFHDSSDLAKLAVNKIPSLGTKKWLTHQVGKEEGGIDTVNLIVEHDNELKVKKKFKKAWQWARLYGGSAIFLSLDDGLDPSEPINLDRINKIQSLTVLHRYELNHDSINKDINSANFGLPDSYRVSNRTEGNIVTIHHSRLIRFDGDVLSEQGFRNNDYWNDSVLNILEQIAKDYEGAYNGVFHALQDFDVDIVKIKNLADICGGDDDDLLQARLRLISLSKSVMSAILIDAEDENYEKLERAFANVDKVLEKCDKRLQMVLGLPHTVIFGEGSTGSLGAGGESEQNTLNDMIAGEQDETLKDNFDYYSKVLQASKQGPTDGKVLDSWSFSFNKLNEPTEKQVADTRKTVAETDQIYWNISVLSSNEIAESRFGGDEFSMETNIDMENRELEGGEDPEAENEVIRLSEQ